MYPTSPILIIPLHNEAIIQDQRSRVFAIVLCGRGKMWEWACMTATTKLQRSSCNPELLRKYLLLIILQILQRLQSRRRNKIKLRLILYP